jgi:hypothetical protein
MRVIIYKTHTYAYGLRKENKKYRERPARGAINKIIPSIPKKDIVGL